MGWRLAKIGMLAVAAAASAAATPSSAATITATAKAKVIKPLILQSIRDLDLGTMLLASGTWSGAVVRLTRDGVLTCPAQLTCSGATQTAEYNVSGSNNETVIIRAPNVLMVNQSNPAKTLTLVPDAPASVVLTNSGPPGLNFSIGGSMTVGSTTAAGEYAGTFSVTAEYQ